MTSQCSPWYPTVFPDRCDGCKGREAPRCVEFCPNDVLAVSEKYNTKGYHPPYAKNPDACVGCRLCSLICPDFAIFVTVEEKDENGKG